MTLIPGNLLINICKIRIKIHRKSTKYPLLEPPWGPLGNILGALGNQDAPKRRPRAPRNCQNLNFRANLAQLGSNLEAQTPPKSFPNAAQDPPRCTFTTSLALLPPLSAFALIFVGFFSDFNEFETWKILVFLKENAIFYKIAIFDKNAKNDREEESPKNHPQILQNPPKIHSKSIRNQKKSITTPKKLWGSAQKRKTAPTWPGPPPPRRPTPWGRTLPGEGFSGFYWKISTPCRREANFRVLA